MHRMWHVWPSTEGPEGACFGLHLGLTPKPEPCYPCARPKGEAMKLSMLRRILAAAACVVLAAGFAASQESRGSITGSVTDASGAMRQCSYICTPGMENSGVNGIA